MTNDPLICQIFRSPRHEGMYLYVKKSEGLARVPDNLLQRFGRAESAMTLLLHPGRTLARVDVDKVVAALEEPGYYLQLPPQREEYMAALRDKNSKLL